MIEISKAEFEKLKGSGVVVKDIWDQTYLVVGSHIFRRSVAKGELSDDATIPI